TFGCYLFPTLTGERRQTIAARWNELRECGWKLELDEGAHLLLTVADGGRRWSVRGPVPLLGREWVLAAAMVDLANGR
ncbi:hypothetical protein ABTH29_20665, partial [Acinetobacter baumannii]